MATRTFQALRIAVNDELGALERCSRRCRGSSVVGGRAAVIAFHSLEDRAVKQAFRALEGRCTCPPGLPVCACGAQRELQGADPQGGASLGGRGERNPRARSARLRAVERVA